MTLEEKLTQLEECGFKLAAPFTVRDLLKLHRRREYEEPGWYTVLLTLAATEGPPSWRPHCKNLCLLDMECIEDHGDYISVAEELVRICQGSLVLEDVKDYVDIGEGQARLSFKHLGKEVRVDFQVDNDWLDPNIFRIFGNLLEEADPSATFVTYYVDQSVLVGCVTKAQLEKLKALGTGFDQ